MSVWRSDGVLPPLDFANVIRFQFNTKRPKSKADVKEATVRNRDLKNLDELLGRLVVTTLSRVPIAGGDVNSVGINMQVLNINRHVKKKLDSIKSGG